jgi:hypothetical protein
MNSEKTSAMFPPKQGTGHIPEKTFHPSCFTLEPFCSIPCLLALALHQPADRLGVGYSINATGVSETGGKGNIN